jgi:hypothetical protein
MKIFFDKQQKLATKEITGTLHDQPIMHFWIYATLLIDSWICTYLMYIQLHPWKMMELERIYYTNADRNAYSVWASILLVRVDQSMCML